MPKERKCIFCGQPFSGQRRNFEHVIPAWLVKEADLTKRKTLVDFPSRKFDAAMSRLGAQACESCNSNGADLEGRAKAAYVKLRDGLPLSAADGRVLLDWMDKIRVGMWLWALDAGKNDYSINPKFRINERIAHKDRILLASKYPAGAPMEGLEIWGATEFFLQTPSAIGLLINNMALISISSDYLVSRHLSSLSIKQTLVQDSSGDIQIDAQPAPHPCERVAFFGVPYILGQCILPEGEFPRLNLEMANFNPLHEGWAEGPMLRLDDKLQLNDRDLGSLPLFNGNKDAHLILMELQLERAVEFLIQDFLRSDFTKISSAEAQKHIQDMARDFLATNANGIARSKEQYERASGIKLP
jgi:hypothetical protein